jgi:hypothetical protein
MESKAARFAGLDPRETTMTARHWPLASFVLGAGALGASCGSLNGHPGSPSALATVQGQLLPTADTPALGDDVHIAVIWLTTVRHQLKVAVDLPVKPVFPSKYVLSLTEPPPAIAIVRPVASHPEFSVAQGGLVAYEDLNGNGQLDLVSDDAGSFPDRIVATNPNEELLYLDSTTGHLPPELQSGAEGTPLLGYNIVIQGQCTITAYANLPDGGLRMPDMSVCTPTQFLPMTAPYDLPLSNDPNLNLLACQSQSGSPAPLSSAGVDYWSVSDAGTPPRGYPAPGAPHLTCLDGGTSYEFQTCHTTGGLCSSETVCDKLQQVDLGGAVKPDGWPCP